MTDEENKVKKILECPICFETFKNPKVLPCQHSFCLECIYKTYKVKNQNGKLLTCPLCNQKVELKKANRNAAVLTEEDFKACLPDNYTLKELLEMVVKPRPTPRRQGGGAGGVSNVSDPPSATVPPAAVSKPKPLPRCPKPPAPDPPGKQKPFDPRLSMIQEETVPPAPLRRLPNKEVKLLFPLEPELIETFTPKKMLLDLHLNVYLGFQEDAGIRKYDGTSGKFLIKFAASGCITDFALDRISGEIICIMPPENNRSYLQSYDSTNGQRLKCLKTFNYFEDFTLITSNNQKGNEYVLAGSKCLATYNSKKDVFKYIPALPNLPNLDHLVDMECNKSGTLYLLFKDQPKDIPVVYVIPLAADTRSNSIIGFSIPIYSNEITDPKSFSISMNSFYICDYDGRCIRVYRKTKPDITKIDSIISKPNYYNWRPKIIRSLENSVFIFDSESKSVYVYSDNQVG